MVGGPRGHDEGGNYSKRHLINDLLRLDGKTKTIGEKSAGSQVRPARFLIFLFLIQVVRIRPSLRLRALAPLALQC